MFLYTHRMFGDYLFNTCEFCKQYITSLFYYFIAGIIAGRDSFYLTSNSSYCVRTTENGKKWTKKDGKNGRKKWTENGREKWTGKMDG